MNQDFTFKPVDLEGLETLNVVATADKFNRWMYETILPYCSGDILEIGSGTGNISEYFLREGHRIYLSDIRENYCHLLQQKFKDNPNLIGISELDLVHPEFEKVYAHLIGKFNTVFALNVVEHIENDSLAIANCYKLLKDGGSIIILVPAYQWLYNNFDKELYHFKRYVRKGLSKLLEENKFTIVRAMSFNAFGILGWFVSGSLMRKKIIPSGQMKLYNKLVPVFRLFDHMLFKRVGLSVIAVGKK
jgi:2-polyprenyl-3-methyl-5-hydroxy-6-metoxy-1,4-benzoquinol methylase